MNRVKLNTLNIEELSLEQKAAQLIMIDIPSQGHQPEAEVKSLLHRYSWNGVILFAKNIVDRQQTEDLIQSLYSVCPISPFIAIDQEGGIVDRLRFGDMALSPGLMALGANGSTEDCYNAHRIMGHQLRQLGVTWDFAPCVDVNNNPANPIIGVRSFGEDPEKTATLAAQAVQGLQDSGVIATVKHFPGHGNTTFDSHLALPSISSSLEELEKCELIPFRRAICQGVESIMTAHITFPALDSSNLPATLSPLILTGLLREKLNFQGVIVTDSLSMRSIADTWGFGPATVMSIKAGADLVLALGSVEQQLEAVEGLIAAVRNGEISEARLDESLQRLNSLRRRYGAQPQPISPLLEVLPAELQGGSENQSLQQVMRTITDKTVTLIANEDNLLPLKADAGEKILVITPDLLPQSPLGENTLAQSLTPLIKAVHANTEEARFNISAVGPVTSDLARRAAEADYAILCLYARGALSDAQKEIAAKVLEANARTVVVALSSPYIKSLMPQARTFITAFNYGPFSLESLSRAIMGQLQPQGRLPITLG